jgi:hypothetical protein
MTKQRATAIPAKTVQRRRQPRVVLDAQNGNGFFRWLAARCEKLPVLPDVSSRKSESRTEAARDA